MAQSPGRMTKPLDIVVVTPTYNEKDNLPILAAGVLAHPGFRLLVVDDGSPDGTGEVAEDLARTHPGRVEVMHRTGPRGLGRSYIDGLRRALESGRRSDLPDGRRPLAQSRVSARASPRPPPLRRGHRLEISDRRERGELAAASDLSERLRQSLRPRGDADLGGGLHQRLPLLAARGAGAPAARPHGVERLRVHRRDAVRGVAARLPHRRGADHLRRAAARPEQGFGTGPARVADRAVAVGARSATARRSATRRRRDRRRRTLLAFKSSHC